HRVLPLRIISSFFFIFQLLYSSSFFPYTTLFRSCCTDHSCSCSQLACMSAVAGGAPWRTRAKSAKAVSALRAMRSVDGCQRTGLLFLSISLDILRPIGARRHAESLAEAAAEMRGAVETPGEGDLA